MNDKSNEQSSDKPIATLNTGQGDGKNNFDGENKQPARDSLPLLGIFAVTFGIISVFAWSIFFVPLALILGIIALFTGQVGWGISAILLSVIGTLTSPMLLMMLGLGALLAYFGLPMPMM